MRHSASPELCHEPGTLIRPSSQYGFARRDSPERDQVQIGTDELAVALRDDGERLTRRDEFPRVVECGHRGSGRSVWARVEAPEGPYLGVEVGDPGHRFVGDVLPRDEFPACQAVIAGNNEEARFLVQWRDVQARCRERHAYDGGVHLAVQQDLGRAQPAQVSRVDGDVRMPVAEFADYRGDDDAG